jgi:hypothetical protein
MLCLAPCGPQAAALAFAILAEPEWRSSRGVASGVAEAANERAGRDAGSTRSHVPFVPLFTPLTKKVTARSEYAGKMPQSCCMDVGFDYGTLYTAQLGISNDMKDGC